MNATLLIFTILALASPIFGDENAEIKKQEKRGVVNFGYGGYGGGHYPGAIGAHGLTGYSGYGGYGHGYVPSAPIYPLSHGHGLNHGIVAAPSIAHAYSAPVVPAIAPYSHGYNHHAAPLLSAAPWRVGYNGLHGAGYGHGLGYVNGW